MFAVGRKPCRPTVINIYLRFISLRQVMITLLQWTTCIISLHESTPKREVVTNRSRHWLEEIDRRTFRSLLHIHRVLRLINICIFTSERPKLVESPVSNFYGVSDHQSKFWYPTRSEKPSTLYSVGPIPRLSVGVDTR